MEQRVWRLYVDTSVFGGVFDVAEAFDVGSRRVVDALADRTAFLLFSATLIDELNTELWWLSVPK